jgi:hypothetical protein
LSRERQEEIFRGKYKLSKSKYTGKSSILAVVIIFYRFTNNKVSDPNTPLSFLLFNAEIRNFFFVEFSNELSKIKLMEL